MRYADFTTELDRHPGLELVFEFADIPIRRGYHLTEVLQVTVSAIDCGGAIDRWMETVLQLVEPGHDNASGFMSTDKLVAILRRSQAQVALSADSMVLLEFRVAGAGAAQRFHVTGVRPGGAGQLRVLSEGAHTQCKAAARTTSAGGATRAGSGCCAPASMGEVSALISTSCCTSSAVGDRRQAAPECCA